jgi:N-acetylmuramoyl-L-alanine amidase
MAGTSVQIKVRNRLNAFDNVDGATVTVSSSAAAAQIATAVTKANGVATIDLAGLTTGPFTLQITPANTTTAPAGPDITRNLPVPSRIYRSLSAVVTIAKNRIASAIVAAGQTSNGTMTVGGSNPNVTVDLQPVWMASPNKSSRGATAIDLIIVHHTGGARIGGAIQTFLSSSGDQVSAHYVIDTDGQIVMMVRDEDVANQAGKSFWDGVNSVNGSSIGIEIVNASGAYPTAQYTALMALLERLLTAHSTISRDRIVGHADIAHDGNFVLGRKSGDPGLEFEWTRLEAQNLGKIPMTAALAATAYGGFFVAVPAGALVQGDNDKKQRFGGKTGVASVTGTPVQELQEDLRDIGYSVGTPDGDFGKKTERAVEIFQEHFFTGTRSRSAAPDGKVDRATAELIKQVRP